MNMNVSGGQTIDIENLWNWSGCDWSKHLLVSLGRQIYLGCYQVTLLFRCGAGTLGLQLYINCFIVMHQIFNAFMSIFQTYVVLSSRRLLVEGSSVLCCFVWCIKLFDQCYFDYDVLRMSIDFRSLSRQDIQVLVGYGCPSADKKVVFSAKLLRKHVHLDEGDVSVIILQPFLRLYFWQKAFSMVFSRLFPHAPKIVIYFLLWFWKCFLVTLFGYGYLRKTIQNIRKGLRRGWYRLYITSRNLQWSCLPFGCRQFFILKSSMYMPYVILFPS